jgi:hypothetical protein
LEHLGQNERRWSSFAKRAFAGDKAVVVAENATPGSLLRMNKEDQGWPSGVSMPRRRLLIYTCRRERACRTHKLFKKRRAIP